MLTIHVRVAGTGKAGGKQDPREYSISAEQVRRHPCWGQAQQSRGEWGPSWGRGQSQGQAPAEPEAWQRLEGTEGSALLPSEGVINTQECGWGHSDSVHPRAQSTGSEQRPETGNPGVLQQSGVNLWKRRWFITSNLQKGQSLRGTIAGTGQKLRLQSGRTETEKAWAAWVLRDTQEPSPGGRERRGSSTDHRKSH